MGLTQFALTRNRVMAVLLAVIVALGISAYNRMARDDMPPFTIRIANIVTAFPGASPERVESLVTDPLEKIVQEIPEIKKISSESRTGLSVIKIEMFQSVSVRAMEEANDLLRRKLEKEHRNLPDGVFPPELKDDGIGVVYGIVIGISNDGFTYDELYDTAEYLRNKILALPAASEVKIAGKQDAQVYIDYDPARLAKMGLSASRLQALIASTNILYPGGSVALGDERIILEPTGSFGSLDDLKATLLSLPGGNTVALGDITTITRGFKTPLTRRVRINGKTGLSLSVGLREGANLIQLGKEVDTLLEEELQDIPIGLELVRVASQDQVVEKSVDDFVNNLLQSVGVVFTVMLLMLGVRTGLVVASLIPMTMVLTFGLMDITGMGLNKVTLAALIMALGMLVDNAIVISEAVLVGISSGRTAREAAKDASAELAIPLLVSSMTTSVAFLPFYLAQSVMGEIVSPLFVVISLSLLASWLLSLTMIPMLIVATIGRSDQSGDDSQNDGRVVKLLRQGYEPLIRLALRQRIVVLVLTLALFVGSVMTFKYLPFIFFPDSDRNLVTVDVKLPLGTRIETTEATIARIENHIRQNIWDDGSGTSTGVVDMTSFVGEGPPSYDLGYQQGEPSSSYGHLLLNTSSGSVNQKVIDGVSDFALEQLPDALVTARRLTGGGGGVPIAVRITGSDPAKLYQIAEATKQKMLAIPGTRNVSDNWGPRIKKFVVQVDQANAERAGFSNQDVALSLQTVLTGFRTGEFREDTDSIPIVMRAAESAEYSIADVATTTIHAQQSGRGVALSQVANIDQDWQYPRIRRYKLARTITVESFLEGGFTARDITVELRPWLDKQQAESWPRGYSFELGGESERSDEGMRSVTDKLPLAGAIILLLLVWQFNSIRKTTIVLATIPLGLIGVILGLHLFKSFFGFFGFLGIISLAGIVINNAIVLLDRIRIEIEDEGRTPYDAIVAACGHRLRPILLTTMTTTLGLIPLYLGGGLMWEPMAVAIMVGLMFGTLITLILVPVLYSLLFRVKSPKKSGDKGAAKADSSAGDSESDAPEPADNSEVQAGGSQAGDDFDDRETTVRAATNRPASVAEPDEESTDAAADE